MVLGIGDRGVFQETLSHLLPLLKLSHWCSLDYGGFSLFVFPRQNLPENTALPGVSPLNCSSVHPQSVSRNG